MKKYVVYQKSFQNYLFNCSILQNLGIFEKSTVKKNKKNCKLLFRDRANYMGYNRGSRITLISRPLIFERSCHERERIPGTSD